MILNDHIACSRLQDSEGWGDTNFCLTTPTESLAQTNNHTVNCLIKAK